MRKLPAIIFWFTGLAWQATGQQNVGIGTISPEARLHIRSTGWIKTIFENDAGQPRGYIGTDNNGTITLAANAFWNGNAWVYPNAGTSMYMQMHRVNNRFEFWVRPDEGNEQTAMVINTAGRVGIGTTEPQQMLSIKEGLNIDQQNANRATLLNGIRFGSNSTDGIGSNRGLDHNNQPINNLLFFTNNTARMGISRDGNVGIGIPSGPGKLTIAKESLYNQPEFAGRSHILLNGAGTGKTQYMMIGADNLNGLSFINAEVSAPYVNAGSVLLLQYRGNLSVGGITNPTHKLEVEGDARITGNVKVQGDRGLLINNNNTQLVRQVRSVTVSGINFGSLETKFIDFTWPEAFASTPDCYVGNIVSGSGGWAECVLSVALVNTNGGRLYIFNPRNTSFSPVFSVNIIAFGGKN